MWGVNKLFSVGRSLCSQLLPAARSFSLGHRDLLKNHFRPQLKLTDRWNNKRVMFGVYDNIGILGEFQAHPRDLIVGPSWLKGWKGNELQRCIRKRQMVGSRMFYRDREDLNKRIRFLYRRFNRYGKHR
ncbi:39S ribosomal L51, mitochondrial [Pelobates cultripes]|uniref:Large ribosomal subunit protein mL51 n=1 Tax=Pelobates cultripes TaxID=61616 RepID=A0AAD1WUC7_PELCU|nr:39S ribosomal L51, mitochondrial [Pelobates cultripes]